MRIEDKVIALLVAEGLSGWLGIEILDADTSREYGTWTWDITRPIADQELEIKAQCSSHRPSLRRARAGLLSAEPLIDLAAEARTGLLSAEPLIDLAAEARTGLSAEPLADLIARSSIGVGLANIRENGIAAELADLNEEFTSGHGRGLSHAALAAIAHAPSRVPREHSAESSCTNFSPSWFTGRWQDWHRGHGSWPVRSLRYMLRSRDS
jgi:hypothetical protein